MDDRIRISDADRERVAGRLREHFAEGRLSTEELDERLSAALSAKTFGDLRHVMTDLPEPVPAGSPAGAPTGRREGAPGPWAMRHGPMFRRGPRIWPLALVLLIGAAVIPGAGWLFLAFFKVVLVLWLVACLAGIFAMARFRRRLRSHFHSGDFHSGDWQQSRDWQSRDWHSDHFQSGDGPHWRHYQWRG